VELGRRPRSLKEMNHRPSRVVASSKGADWLLPIGKPPCSGADGNTCFHPDMLCARVSAPRARTYTETVGMVLALPIEVPHEKGADDFGEVCSRSATRHGSCVAPSRLTTERPC